MLIRRVIGILEILFFFAFFVSFAVKLPF